MFTHTFATSLVVYVYTHMKYNSGVELNEIINGNRNQGGSYAVSEAIWMFLFVLLLLMILLLLMMTFVSGIGLYLHSSYI